MMAFLTNFFFLLGESLLPHQCSREQSQHPSPTLFPCPSCGSHHTIKNGSTQNGKPKRQCKECGRQLVINPSNKTIEATQFLLQERQIAGVGIDTHGVDSGLDETFAIDRLVLEQPRIVLENLTNLDRLPPTGTTLVIGILRLEGGSGSPVAVLALVP